MNKYFLALTALGISVAACAQQAPVITAKDYEHAESFLGSNPALIQHNGITPNWLPDDHFWYRTQSNQFMLFNPAKRTVSPAFDHQKLASALSVTTGKAYKATDLPFQTISFSPNYKGIIFQVDGKQYKFDTKTSRVNPDTSHALTAVTATGFRGRRGAGNRGSNEVLSPNGKKAAFIKDYNLWVRDVKTNAQTQLTTDGVKNRPPPGKAP